MLEYSNKIFNEHNGFKNKQNRSLQEERPNSTERKSTDFVTPLLTLKKKKGNYSKTVGIKNKD